MKYLIFILLLLGCSDHDIVPSIQEPEHCIDPGSTYVESFSYVYGNCPGLPAVRITIPDDGTFPVNTNETCQKVTTEDCKTNNDVCVYKSDGCVINSATTVIFKNDGTAHGYLTVEAKCGNNCNGIYELYLIKD